MEITAKKVLGIFLCIIITRVSQTQSVRSGSQNDTYWAIDTFVKAGMACHPENPGLSLSAVRNGNVVISKGYGVKNLDRNEPVTSETLFGIASLSKAFAATLILKLIEENESIDLTTKVKDILNNDAIFYDSLRSEYTTLEDLLAHRLGIPSNNDIRLDNTLTRANLVRRLQYLEPIGGFRTSFYYSNLMFGLLTYIAENVGGKTWEELVKEKLLDPLSMTSTTFATTANQSSLDIAQGYQNDEGRLFPVPFEFSRHWGTLCGSGCILSNSEDMVQWMKFHLAEGKNQNGDNVVSPALLKQAYKNQNSLRTSFAEDYYTRPTTPVTWALNNYGLGWRLGYYRGYKVITHTGTTWGYRAIITLVPALQIGVFAAMTGDDPNYMFRTNIHSYIIDILSGNQPWLNSSSVCSFPEPWKDKQASSGDAFERNNTISRNKTLYTGSFYNNAYDLIDVYINSSTGQLMAREGVGLYVLHPQSGQDEFYGEGIGIVAKSKKISKLLFRFENGDDHATAVVIPGFNAKFPPIFKKDSGNVSGTASRKKLFFPIVFAILSSMHLL